jgi:hypothetical protein
VAASCWEYATPTVALGSVEGEVTTSGAIWNPEVTVVGCVMVKICGEPPWTPPENPIKI